VSLRVFKSASSISIFDKQKEDEEGSKVFTNQILLNGGFFVSINFLFHKVSIFDKIIIVILTKINKK